ncbi:hypothetical protein, partial [Halalkalibaculum sp. DA384]|uniref:hypothetical protein n=1 Tax=Halalkalibaculum sp. DA384 TaxID=3373606 RepID=UPI003754DB59
TFAAKTFAFILILGTAAACGSVTDATLDGPDRPATVEQPAEPTPETFGNGDDMEPILDKPD